MDAHVTDNWFDRELRRRELARRLVVHHARTQTISALTNLTHHQLFSLRQRWQVTQETRHRGPSPTSFSILLSSRSRTEASALTVLCRVLNAIPPSNQKCMRKTPSAMEVGERLCEVFEIYSAYLPQSNFEFEHLMLLAQGLARADVIAIGNCTLCRATILIDLLATRPSVCSHCLQNVQGSSAKRRKIKHNEHEDSSNQEVGYVQAEFF